MPPKKPLKFIKLPGQPKKYSTSVFVPESKKQLSKEINRNFVNDRIMALKLGGTELIVRSDALDVKKILKLESFESRGITFYNIWFNDKSGKPFQRSTVFKIGERYHEVDFKYLRLQLERDAQNRQVLIDNFHRK